MQIEHTYFRSAMQQLLDAGYAYDMAAKQWRRTDGRAARIRKVERPSVLERPDCARVYVIELEPPS